MIGNERPSGVRKKERSSSRPSERPVTSKAGTSTPRGSSQLLPPGTKSSPDGFRKYLFATIALEKRAIRVLEVVAGSEDEARKLMPNEFGVAFIAIQPAKSDKRRVRRRLIRDAEEWANFLDRFFLTPKQFEENLRKQLLPPGASFLNPFR